jgi:HSP90 family molecular chaperone
MYVYLHSSITKHAGGIPNTYNTDTNFIRFASTTEPEGLVSLDDYLSRMKDD